eukprot:XP_015570961.1 uncharacterized protein LOC8270879 isoform X2 [Ricinus communis]
MNFSTIISATVVLALSIFLLQWSKFGITTTSFSSSRELTADLIVKNGVIFTSDDSLPFADSFAVQNGRILRVGNYSSLQDLAGNGTKVVNLEGKLVVPGFIDSHVHLIFGGLQMIRVELRGVNQKDEFVRRVRDAVRNLKEGSWVLGGGWNNDLWGGELPAASWIDDIAPKNPVWLTRMDGHMGLANSVALKLAGINNLLEDPNGGTIMRSANGEPTGLIIDAAMKLILSYIPEVSVDEKREALLIAGNLALMRGVTTVVDFGRYFPGASVEHSWEDLSDVYQWADSLGKMRIRVCLFFPMETWSRLSDLITKVGRALSDWIYLGGVKAFADGSLGSNSALFYEPDHLLDDADSAIKKLGMDRAQNGSYQFRSLLSSNAQLALGSDWPVANINPLGGIKTAVKRIPPGWENAWIPSECLSLKDAIIAHTISAARACFLDCDLGSLSPGKLADFVILSTNSWDDFETEASAAVEATYVAGAQAYP